MLKENILELLAYNHWANKKLLTAINEQIIDLEMVSSFNTIKKTICHSWDAETIWFERMQGGPITPWPASGNFQGNYQEMIAAILHQEERIIEFIQNKPESFLLETISYKNLKGHSFVNANFQVLQHMVNHTTMHRGQLVTMMRQTGITEIPSTDLIAYYREQNVTA